MTGERKIDTTEILYLEFPTPTPIMSFRRSKRMIFVQTDHKRLRNLIPMEDFLRSMRSFLERIILHTIVIWLPRQDDSSNCVYALKRTYFKHGDHKVFTLRSQRNLRGLCVSSAVLLCSLYIAHTLPVLRNRTCSWYSRQSTRLLEKTWQKLKSPGKGAFD